jgi:hypothetical protein
MTPKIWDDIELYSSVEIVRREAKTGAPQCSASHSAETLAKRVLGFLCAQPQIERHTPSLKTDARSTEQNRHNPLSWSAQSAPAVANIHLC